LRMPPAGQPSADAAEAPLEAKAPNAVDAAEAHKQEQRQRQQQQQQKQKPSGRF